MVLVISAILTCRDGGHMIDGSRMPRFGSTGDNNRRVHLRRVAIFTMDRDLVFA
jgi:hypothetical protein